MSDWIDVEVRRLLDSRASGRKNLMTIDDVARCQTTMNDVVRTRAMLGAKIDIETMDTGAEEVVTTTIQIVIEEVDNMVDLAMIIVVDLVRRILAMMQVAVWLSSKAAV